jgi:hypothetical protein
VENVTIISRVRIFNHLGFGSKMKGVLSKARNFRKPAKDDGGTNEEAKFVNRWFDVDLPVDMQLCHGAK